MCISEGEAKNKIYNVSCERYFGFGIQVDEETSNKFEGLSEKSVILLSVLFMLHTLILKYLIGFL